MNNIPDILKNYSGYAVVMYFDDESTGKIEDLWRKVGSIYLQIRARPHITLCNFREVDVGMLMAAVGKFCASVKPFSVRFGSVGSFWDENAIFFAPIVTRELLDHHRLLNEILKQAGIVPLGYYSADLWIPHCTIDIQIEADDFARKFEIAREARLDHDIIIEKVEIVKFMPPEPIFTLSLSKTNDK